MIDVPQWLGWLTPFCYAAGAIAGLAVRDSQARWRVLAVASRCGLFAALVACMNLGVSSLVGLLVAFLGWIIGDYARRYLRGEAGQDRFILAYQGTLATVGTVVATNDLAVLIAGWAASSLGVHHLLAFYRERPAAILVAHKKFLSSRLADICLVVAAILLYRAAGSLDLDRIAAYAGGAASLDGGAQAAASLIAIAALIKCAQLPLHGWLIQVMEAPTPVSALLHAGIVNLAGYLLLRLAPLIDASFPAQLILVVVGSLSAAMAGLALLTRVTIKVRLAWSTCSQMGLMLMECGLGLHDLALLHLLAHSLYKAHAFLTSGGTVGTAGDRAAARAAETGSRWRLVRPLCALLAAFAIATVAALASMSTFGGSTPHWIVPALAAFGLAPLLWRGTWRDGTALKGLAALSLGSLLYPAWHGLLAAQLGLGSAAVPSSLAVFATAVFLGLYVAQACVFARPDVLRGRTHDWIYAGLYLDERVTRLIYRIWPPRTALPASQRRVT